MAEDEIAWALRLARGSAGLSPDQSGDLTCAGWAPGGVVMTFWADARG